MAHEESYNTTQKLKMFHKNMKKFVNNKNKYTNDGKMHIASSYIVWYYRTR